MRSVFKGIKPLVIVGALAITLAGCSKETAEAQREAPQAAVPAVAVKPYPLDVCVVADEKLGSMGDPYVFVHEGQELKLCCKGCLKDFQKEPAKYLVKVDAVKKS